METLRIKYFLVWLWKYFGEEAAIPDLFVDITFHLKGEQREVFSYLCEKHKCGFRSSTVVLNFLKKVYA